jgi:bacterioferritin
MESTKELLTALNSLMTDELAVINQYITQSEMCATWGYSKLHNAIRKQAIDKMHRAEWLIEQILNNAIKHASQVGDQGTVDLLTKILEEEEGHVDGAEIPHAQMERMNLQNYMVNQVESQ